ncbi:probable transcription factor At5g61620 [Pyrus x bretschneideri]|uniref:probable transcription factor At5g61620 n=1 Tax=Pyrus x bretschneideri TaxID=225117 RepID=UPI00202F698B|nr:probable transcription factor At5g61620 [Pyrus x bretschneideri]
MVKESARKYSHCGHNGHNSRTCNHGHGNKGVCLKLFGVNIMEKEEDSIKKSYSMGNLLADGTGDHNNNAVVADHDAGYLSDGLIHNKRHKAAHERKKGRPWTEEEHRVFLAGLKKLGKGDWRGIARNFVTTRTPTQVASHAQKYFLRQATNDKRKRRSSLFDMHFKELSDQGPQDSSISPTKSADETSPQASSSKTRPLKINTANNSPPASNVPTRILNRFPHLCLDSPPAPPLSPTCTLPNYPAMPFMMRIPANVPNAPMTHFYRPSYHHMIKNHGHFPTCAPVISHPSGIPSSPRSLPSSPSMAITSMTSAAEKDALELKIVQPQPSQGASLSPPSSSGAIRVT